MARLAEESLLALSDRPLPTPAERAAAILAAADPARDWSVEPLGRVTAELLAIRRDTIGPTIEATTACGACDGRLSVELDALALIGAAPEPTATGLSLEVTAGDARLVVRPLTPDDLEAAAAQGDLDGARRALLGRALIGGDVDGRPLDAGDLRPELDAAIADAVERLDPLADPQLEVVCPDCATTTRATFDVASFVWTELRRRGEHLVVEIDHLARRYGWSEAEIVALPPDRRRRYLELDG